MGNILELVISVLKTTPQRWLQLAETIPIELLKRAPATKEWSAHECLQHLVDTERIVFPARIEYLLRGEDFPAFNPDADGSKPRNDLSPKDLAKEFEIVRAKNLTILSKVQEEDLSRKAKHQELGIVSLGEMINEWAGHDLMHTVQGERAMMQVFMKGAARGNTFLQHTLLVNNILLSQFILTTPTGKSIKRAPLGRRPNIHPFNR